MEKKLNQRQRIAILKSLIGNFEQFSPKIKVVAKYISDNPENFALESMRTTAEKTGVSTFTLTRMADVLGFDSFEDLRQPFRQALSGTTVLREDLSWLHDQYDQGTVGKDQVSFAKTSIGNVVKSLQSNDLEKLERVVAKLFSARTVFVCAVRASYALAYYFHYVGRMSLPSIQLIPGQINSPVDDLNNAGPHDVLVAITFSPYSKETIEACKFACERGAKLILISDSEIVVPGLHPEEILVASTKSTHPFSCFSGAMVVLENLIALMVNNGGEAALSNIQSYENLRNEFSAYWKLPNSGDQ